MIRSISHDLSMSIYGILYQVATIKMKKGLEVSHKACTWWSGMVCIVWSEGENESAKRWPYHQIDNVANELHYQVIDCIFC